MPKWVQNGVDNVVDSFWPDVKEEAKMKVLSGTHAMVPIVEGEPPSCCPNPYYVIRAYFLYHMFPSDKTMWGSFKDPVWWAFTLIALVPVFGISQMFYFVVFFLIDWADEYQIVRFILGFKGLSFVTTGVLPALIASIQYYICTAHTGKCYSEGPGEPLWTYIVFVVQVLIVWIAFAILPFTYKKGARKLIVRGRIMRKYDRNGNGVLSPEEARDYYRRRDTKKKAARAAAAKASRKSKKAKNSDISFSDDDESTNDAGLGFYGTRCCCCTRFYGRGGALRWFIFYDIFILLIAIIILALPLYIGPTPVQDNDADGDGAKDGVVEDTWKFRASLQFAKIAYGLLSFPFVMFNLPLMGKFLTHAQPTAYNRNGTTVPYVKPKKVPDVEELSSDDGEGAGEAAHKEFSKLKLISKRFRGSEETPTPSEEEYDDDESSISSQDGEGGRPKSRRERIASRLRLRGKGSSKKGSDDDSDDDYTYLTADEDDEDSDDGYDGYGSGSGSASASS